MNVEREVRSWLPKYIEKNFAHSRPVSSQAIDQTTGKVVGVNVAIIVDPKQPRPPMIVDFLDPEIQPVQHQIAVFLDEIEEGVVYKLSTQLSPKSLSPLILDLWLGLDAAEMLGLKGITSDIDPRFLNNLMLSVHKDYWSRGIATELVRKSVELAKKDKDCLVAKVSIYLCDGFVGHFRYISEFTFCRS